MFGLESAKVDLKLDKKEFIPGEIMTGKLFIKGGSREKNINSLESILHVKVMKNKIPKVIPLINYTLREEESFSIQSNTYKELPFELTLPRNIPVSTDKVEYDLVTKLDIDLGKNASARDEITVHLPPLSNNILKSTETLGFFQEDNFITEGGQFFRLVHEYTGTEIDLSFFEVSEGVFVKMNLQKFTTELPSPDVLANQFFVPSSVHLEEYPEIVDKAIYEALKNPLKFKSGLPIYKHNTGNTTKAFVTGFIFGI
ncbi:sporulation protein [Neobacillus niacini]|uniref:sporulation protein n=1 Tax=Neobacillus niacini TaxID=86668 RepID=UPI0021CB22A1|nr:sporulation protein [Neobacillus niacini]MCM3768772.1 sporulation protein [Neobacillus niacini]